MRLLPVLSYTSSRLLFAESNFLSAPPSHVLDFLESEGYFRFKADAEVSSKCLYEVYKVWCDDNACRPVSPNRLSTELNQQSLRYNLEATNNIYLPGGRRVRGFVGIEALIHPCQQ